MSSAIVSATCIEEFQWEEMVSVASTVCRTGWQGISKITKILSMILLTFSWILQTYFTQGPILEPGLIRNWLKVDNYTVDWVRRGLSADSNAWCEDAHYAAISVLYNIAIFNYSTTAERRYSFNEYATHRYVCLRSLLGHTNVLHGILQDSPPIIPPRVVSQAVSNDTINWPADVFCVLQRNSDIKNIAWHRPSNQ